MSADSSSLVGWLVTAVIALVVLAIGYTLGKEWLENQSVTAATTDAANKAKHGAEDAQREGKKASNDKNNNKKKDDEGQRGLKTVERPVDHFFFGGDTPSTGSGGGSR